MRRIWSWLSIDNNRKVLSFLGSGLCVVVGAFWVLYEKMESQEGIIRPDKPTLSSINISDTWREIYPNTGNISQTIQEGNSFRYVVKGSLYGKSFQSSGNGTLRGKNIDSIYQSTIPSTGYCSGTISVDGMQIKSTCVDSVNGTFESAWARDRHK